MTPFIFRPAMINLFLGFFAFMVIAQTIATKPTIEVGGAVLGVMALITLIQTRTLFPLPRNMILICGAVLLFMAFSCIWGINAPDARHQISRWILVFALCIPLLSFARMAPVPNARMWMVLVGAFSLAALYMIGADQSNYVLEYRFKGPGFEPTDLNKPIGVLTMIAPALLAPLLVTKHRRDRLIAGGAFILLAALVIPSFAQSALLSLVVIALCFVMPVGSRLFWRLVRVTTIVGLLGLPFVMTPLYHHVADTLKQTGVMRQAASAERLEIWSAISQRIIERPVLGWGYNAARVLEMPVAKVYFFDPIVAHPHNFIMQIWLESGVLGAVVLCLIFTLMWRRIETEPDLHVRRLYFTSVSATIAFALVGWNMWQTWWVITLFFIGFLTIFSARIMMQSGLKNRE